VGQELRADGGKDLRIIIAQELEQRGLLTLGLRWRAGNWGGGLHGQLA
jgi:hypothetical protein